MHDRDRSFIMSSDALMEKPMISGIKYRCRKKYCYLILASFLLWFILFFLYYSSLAVSDTAESFSDNNRMNVVQDDDVATKDTGQAEIRGINNGDNTVEDNKNGVKPISFFVDGAENVDQILGLVNALEAEDNETQSTGTANDQEKESIVDPSSVVEETNEASIDKPVQSSPATKSRRSRRAGRRPRRQNAYNKPAVYSSSSSPTVQKRTQKVALAAESDPASCLGRYVYIHNLPKIFNQDLLDNCRSLSRWTDMCEYTANFGLGPPLPDFEKIYSKTGWFATNQFLLEVIFHSRMRQYKCLTNDPSLASAIFVPYYAGLDVGRYLWESDGFMRDYDALHLVKWLKSRNEWNKMGGRDHFVVAGRINWDFRRDPKNESDWGNELLNLRESRNMTMLVLESSPWNYNDFAIPYPTYFHPSSDIEVFQWQNKMRRLKRRHLFSFAGAPRPNLHESIRNEIIDQCRASKRKCRLLECENKNNKCYKPAYVMKMFQNSVYCLQPPGDSYTRRSVFDSILAGCIPVFFHPGTAYVQYIWHLPKDYTKYSVFIPADDVKSGKASIERILQQIPRQKRLAMREEVIKLIPKVIYADPGSRLETLEDAFDLTIKGVLDRVESIRKQIREGKDVNSEFDEEDSWKYFTYGTVGRHEWDPIFANRILKGA